MAKIKNKNREIVYKKILAYKNLRGEWKKTIDKALEQFDGTEQRKLIDMIIAGRPMVPICMDLFISQRTFFAWRDAVINAVVLQAAYDQLIKPNEEENNA